MKKKRLILGFCGFLLITSLSVTTPAQTAPVTEAEGRALLTTNVGILECDTYVDNYVTCISKDVPPNQRAPLLRELEQSIQLWQSMTGTPGGKTDVINACRRAKQAARQAMTVYGCKWE